MVKELEALKKWRVIIAAVFCFKGKGGERKKLKTDGKMKH